MVTLITRAKDEWLDSLISLRDEYTHYSTLQEYRNFWFPIEKWVEQRPLNNLTTINKPTIEVNGKPIPALEFMQKIKAKLVDFLGDFLRLCEFTPDRRPKISLRCGECNHVFAKMNSPKNGQLHIPNQFLEFKIKDRSRDYGVLICPECGEQTDTDLKFWPPAMFSPPI